MKKEVLSELETFSEQGLIELYYGDESGVNLEPCVPYGWQFSDERASMPTARGKGVNCFGLFTRSNKAVVAVSENSITADFVVEQLERLSFSIEKITVVVLDNARIHTGNPDDGENQVLAAKRIVYILSADVFTAFEYRRNSLAKIEI